MATVEEKVKARTRDGNKIQRVYIVKGVTDETTARAALLLSMSSTLDGFVLDDVNVSVEEITPTIFLGTVQWIKPPGVCSFQFDISTSSGHITQSISTIQKYGTNPPDHKGAIGVVKENGKQKVEGCDIEIPTFSFTINSQLEADDVDAEYIEAIWQCAGKTNDDTITINGIEYGECELLFAGCAGTEDESGKWNLSFKFLASESKTGLTIGGIEDIDKLGWHYMWIAYDDVEDATAYSIAKRPNAVYIEQVYYDADFSALGLCA